MKIAMLIIAAVVLFDIWFVFHLWLVAEMKEKRKDGAAHGGSIQERRNRH